MRNYLRQREIFTRFYLKLRLFFLARNMQCHIPNLANYKIPFGFMKYLKKILVIDDEVDFCFLLKTYLSKKNYEILLANTLEQGMRSLESETPDIVFLDNNLPDGLGWDKIGFIRDAYPRIELNLISAYQYSLPFSDSHHLKIWEKPLDLRQLDKYL